MPNIGYGSNKKTRHMLPNGAHSAEKIEALTDRSCHGQYSHVSEPLHILVVLLPHLKTCILCRLLQICCLQCQGAGAFDDAQQVRCAPAHTPKYDLGHNVSNKRNRVLSISISPVLLHCRRYAAEVAHNVSSKKRKAIVERAAEVCIVVYVTRF